MWPFSHHFIFFTTYKCGHYCRVFVPGRLFQNSLMFVNEARWS
jgi:hypothetical protein